MDCNVKLLLAFDGYTPDDIGLVSYVLGKCFNITECQIRCALGTLDESFLAKKGAIKHIQRAQIQHAIDKLHKSFAVKPPYRIALQAVVSTLRFLRFPGIVGDNGQVNQKYADRLTKYVLHNWDELIFTHVEHEPDDLSDSDKEYVNARLEQIPTLKYDPTDQPKVRWVD